MRPICLNILWKTDEEMELEDVGIEKEVSYSECPRKEYTFLHIEHFYPHRTEPDLTWVSSGGELYIADIQYETLKAVFI